MVNNSVGITRSTQPIPKKNYAIFYKPRFWIIQPNKNNSLGISSFHNYLTFDNSLTASSSSSNYIFIV